MADTAPSIRRRLLLGLVVPLLSLLALSGVVSYYVALHYANAVYDGWLYDSVSSLALVLRTTASGTTLDLGDSARSLFEWDIADKTYFSATSSIAGHIAGISGMPAPPPHAMTYHRGRLFDARIGADDVRVAALELAGGAHNERVLLQVAETKNKRQNLANNILLSALLPQLLLIVVAAAAFWLGIRRGLAPLDAIAATIGERSARGLELQPLSDAGVPVEVRPLAHALNHLLERLDAAWSAQRKFVADAAHQLRTPLAALKLHLERARMATSPAEIHAAIEHLRVSTDRAARLSHQLLTLARAEPEALRHQPMERVDLCEIAFDAGSDWVPRALRKNIDLGFSGSSVPVEALANPGLLREAINNLLDNALKYHPGAGRVTLSVAAQPQPSIAVEDDGPGIPRDQRPLVVQRFYRGEHSGPDGSGLGLAIVKEIASLHGGSLQLLDGADGRGLRVEVRLPGVS